MADTTAITITAIITTGVASGVLGPAIAAKLEVRRDERRFQHERRLQDTAEVRRLIDDTAEQFDAVIDTFERITSIDNAENLSLIEPKGTELLDELQAAVERLTRSLSRLVVRIGRESSLAETCHDAIKVAHDARFALGLVGN